MLSRVRMPVRLRLLQRRLLVTPLIILPRLVRLAAVTATVGRTRLLTVNTNHTGRRRRPGRAVVRRRGAPRRRRAAGGRELLVVGVVLGLLHGVRRLGDAGARVDDGREPPRGAVAVLAPLLLLSHLGLLGVVVAAGGRRTLRCIGRVRGRARGCCCGCGRGAGLLPAEEEECC